MSQSISKFVIYGGCHCGGSCPRHHIRYRSCAIRVRICQNHDPEHQVAGFGKVTFKSVTISR